MNGVTGGSREAKNGVLLRRRVLGYGTLAAGLAASAGTWSLAGNVAQAAPVRTTGKIVLTLTAWAYAGEPLDLGAKLLYEVTAPFRAAHPGVDIQILPALAGNAGSVVPQILAGTPPDVIQDWDAGLWQYLNSGLVLPLDSYIKMDNLDLSVFNAGQLTAYRNSQGQLIALPAQTDPTAVAVNLGVLDQLGLTYPPDNWTYQDAEHLWRAAAGKVQGQWRYGGEIYRSSTPMPDAFYLIGFGGGYVDPTDQARSIADAPGSIAALEWAASLLLSNVVTWRGGGFGSGQVVTRTTGSWSIPPEASAWRKLKWRYYPMPTWPVRPAAFCTTNFWAVPYNVKRPDLAWSLLQWVATSPEWQRGMMKIFLTVPSVQTMWPDWETTVYAVAPVLRDKNVAAFSSAVRQNYAYPTGPFAYATQQAYNILGNWWNKVMTRATSVREAMTQAVGQVGALEQEQQHLVKSAGSLTASYAAFKKIGPGGQYAPPLAQGQGVASSPGKGLVTVKGDSYTLLGSGWDIWNLSDNCAFASMASTAYTATFTCRVAAVSNVSSPYISPWAKFGLMARGDLSDDAADVTLEASGANGIATQMRFAAGLSPTAQTQGNAKAATGLIGASLLTQPNTGKFANYVKQPVWLRLQRKGLVWTFFTSLDGVHWAEAGTPYSVDMGGAWVGLFVSSGNFQFNGHGAIKVTFDHLDFKPGTFVQLGVPTTG